MKKSFMVAAVLTFLLVFSASVCAASNDMDYVGKDMDLKEGEMGIVSVGDDMDYVGKDMDLKEGEVGIISIDETAPEAGVSSYVYGGGALLLVAAGGFALRLKQK